MDSQDWAGLAWLFSMFTGAADFLMAATNPLLIAVSKAVLGYVPSAGFFWLILMLWRLGQDGLFKAAFSSAVIMLAVTYGLQPRPLTLVNGTVIEANNFQHHGYTLVMSLHQSVNSAISAAAEEMNIDGAIIPTEAMVRQTVDQAAARFEGTDLARLIRDYNQQCAPSRRAFQSAADTTPMEAYFAIGLLGGGGLGIPDAQISRIAQMETVASGIAGFFESPGWSTLVKGDTIQTARDAGLIRERRAAGMAALEREGKGFATSRPYALPTKSYWNGVFSGTPESTPSYLKVSEAAGAVGTAMLDNVEAWQPDQGGKEAALGFMPRSCVEAYKVAQFAAEQAYNALVEQGNLKASYNRQTDTDSGVLAANMAWMRIQSQVMAGGEDADPTAFGAMVSGSNAALQMGKNFMSWLELQTLLLLYLAGMAAMFWLAVTCAPFFILYSIIRGVVSLTNWFGLLLFPAIAVIFAHLIAVSTSIAMGVVVYQRAAVSSGWQGGGSELDLVQGTLGMVSALLLGISSWMASKLTGVVTAPLAGAARAAVVTSSDTARLATQVASAVLTKGRSLGTSGGSSTQGGGGGPAGGGGEGGGGSTAAAIAQRIQVQRSMAGSNPSPGKYSGPSLNPPAARIRSVPSTAINDDRFAQGRTPRSQKPKRPKEDDDGQG
jgi:hypothetical protein